MNNKSEEDFLTTVRKTLDTGCDNLEAPIRTRLTRARMAAVEETPTKKTHRRHWLWLVAPLTASLAIILVVAALFLKNEPIVSPPSGEVVADLEIVTAAEAPDFYADLDFYQWLAEGEKHAG